MHEAGASVVGGHSIRDPELKFGYAVTGVAKRRRLLPNSGARPSDQVFLTKPLGTGVLTTALKQGRLEPGLLRRVTRQMADAQPRRLRGRARARRDAPRRTSRASACSATPRRSPTRAASTLALEPGRTGCCRGCSSTSRRTSTPGASRETGSSSRPKVDEGGLRGEPAARALRSADVGRPAGRRARASRRGVLRGAAPAARVWHVRAGEVVRRGAVSRCAWRARALSEGAGANGIWWSPGTSNPAVGRLACPRWVRFPRVPATSRAAGCALAALLLCPAGAAANRRPRPRADTSRSHRAGAEAPAGPRAAARPAPAPRPRHAAARAGYGRRGAPAGRPAARPARARRRLAARPVFARYTRRRVPGAASRWGRETAVRAGAGPTRRRGCNRVSSAAPAVVMLRSVAACRAGGSCTTTPGSRRPGGGGGRGLADRARPARPDGTSIAAGTGRAPRPRARRRRAGCAFAVNRCDTRARRSTVGSLLLVDRRRRSPTRCWTPTWTPTSGISTSSSRCPRAPAARRAARAPPAAPRALPRGTFDDPRLATFAISASSPTSTTARARWPTGCSRSRTR